MKTKTKKKIIYIRENLPQIFLEKGFEERYLDFISSYISYYSKIYGKSDPYLGDFLDWDLQEIVITGLNLIWQQGGSSDEWIRNEFSRLVSMPIIHTTRPRHFKSPKSIDYYLTSIKKTFLKEFGGCYESVMKIVDQGLVWRRLYREIKNVSLINDLKEIFPETKEGPRQLDEKWLEEINPENPLVKCFKIFVTEFYKLDSDYD